jgi:hypothetical protein
MGKITDTLQAFFSENEWATSEGREGSLVTGFAGRNGQWTCVAVSLEAQDQLLFYSVCPVTTPTEKLGAIAELLHRANYGMHIGNFEVDFTDGEIRFKTSIDTEGDEPSVALYRNLIYMNCMMMDRYLPAILKVIAGDTTPGEAVGEVENAQAADQT